MTVYYAGRRKKKRDTYLAGQILTPHSLYCPEMPICLENPESDGSLLLHMLLLCASLGCSDLSSSSRMHCCCKERSNDKKSLNSNSNSSRLISTWLCCVCIFCLVLALQAAPQLDVLDNGGRTAGGKVFVREMGDAGALQVLELAMGFTTRFLQVEVRGKRKIVLVLSTLPEEETASTTTIDSMSVIEISQRHLAAFQGNVTREIEGLIYEQMSYAWLNGLDVAPQGLTEGIAKLIRLEAGLAPVNQFDPDQFVTNTTSPWDRGTYATAHFLHYLEIAFQPKFVASLNAKLANGWSENYTRELLGANVDQLWQEWSMAPHPSPTDLLLVTGSAIAENIPFGLFTPLLLLISAARYLEI